MEQIFLKKDLNIPYKFPFSVNNQNFDELLKFYADSNACCCFLEGKSGSFKTEMMNESLAYLDERVLVFKFKFFEGTTLDDIFLSFFEDLKRYSQQNKISFTKIETTSFTQRINTYLSHINKPCLIVFDSLEEVFNKSDVHEKEAILAYIRHLNSMNKFKILLVSHYFDSLFTDGFSNVFSIKVQPFTKEQVAKYFEHYSAFSEGADIESYYDVAGGNTLFLQNSVNIISTLKISLNSFIAEFRTKRLRFDDFLFQKLVKFVIDSTKMSIDYLTLFNLAIGAEYLYSQNILTKDKFGYLKDKNILSEENGCVFIKPYLKKYIINSISHFEKIKIHTYWKDFYSSQLPLPPNKRALFISRNTMRAQIEYHNMFVTQRLPKEKVQADMSLMSYLNSNLTAWNIKNTNIKDKKDSKDKLQKDKDSVKDNKSGFEKYELTKEELSLLAVPIDMRQHKETEAKENLQRTFEQKEAKHQQDNTLEHLYQQALAAQAEHETEKAFNIYCLMLSQKTRKNFSDYETLILENLANCSQQLNKMSDAIDFYNRLIDLYTVQKDEENINKVKLKIAFVYKSTYKINQARVILENFIKKKTPASDNVIFKAYIELAQIEDEQSNPDRAVDCFKQAFDMLENFVKIEPDYLANAYFKYALLLDDLNYTEAALKYYQKCITTAEKPAVCVSCAYTNIAEIVQEGFDYKKAYDYYNYALKTDTELNNNEGIYYICLKLAGLAKITGSGDVLNWLLKSLTAAKHTHDKTYISNAYLAVGDFYLQNNKIPKAIKAYCFAQKFVVLIEDSQDKLNVINQKLSDLKNKVPKDVFDKYVNSFDKKEE